MTKNNYLCPKCRGFLNANDNIVFSVKTQKGDQGLILLHTELGNYKVTSHPSYNYTEGEPLDFLIALKIPFNSFQFTAQCTIFFFQYYNFLI